uniref:Uncharacterized protein n=1 Tax=Ananas comosus var. bracteatus TaxID=296719 RepID=A0A6V7PAF1_ANACO|nr:unnamed protein product [Ananas comosus var. bracteatus]
MRGHTPVLHVYRRTGISPSFAVDTVKSALAEALAVYYPLAGKLAVDENGRIEADCTGEGALFVAAKSDEYAVDDVDGVVPTAEMRRLFVPAVESHELPCTVLAIQVTFLRCGGMILGTAIHHAVVDGRCFFEFIKMMSDIARHVDGTQPVSLSLDRSLLRARLTPKVTFDHPEYSPVSSSDDNNAPAAPFVVALFELSKDQLRSLKLRCSGGRNPPLPCPHSKPSPHTHGKHIGRVLNNIGDEYVRSVVDYVEVTGISRLPASGKLPRTDLRIVSWLGLQLYAGDFGWGEPIYVARPHFSGGGHGYLVRSPRKDGGWD